MTVTRDYLVTVCSACLRASCWHDLFPCEQASRVSIVTKRASELHALGNEKPEFFSRDAVREHAGPIREVA